MTAPTHKKQSMRKATKWTFRCPARDEVVLTVGGHAFPHRYWDVFLHEHSACVKPTKAQQRPLPQMRLGGAA